MTEQFVFSDKAKRYTYIMILVGILSIVYGVLSGHTERTWANLLVCSYYFMCICLAGLFFVALQYVAQAGWSAGLVRIPQAFMTALPFASAIIVIVVAGGLLSHNLYHHWADPALLNEFMADGKTPNPEYDKIIAGKSAFLNVPFFIGRLVFFVVIWNIFAAMFRRFSLNEDKIGGMINYDKSFKYGAIFLVIFAFTSAIFAFDMMMSIEAHWFSTMFAWYNFASMWVSGLAAIALTTIILKENGYMQHINENHLHDLGKFVFAFSIFWAYVWVAQFILIWYANLPEEVTWFYYRWKPEYIYLFWGNVVINFLIPFLVLMSRDAKRNIKILKFVCVVILLGHWLDFYMMAMPGSVGEERGLDIPEFGILIGFVGLFSFMMMRGLAQASLIPKNHPFLQESLHHHI